MSDYLNSALYGWYPYVCLTVFALGSLVRFDTAQYTWRSGSSQLLRKRQFRWGSNLFDFGILVVIAGHFAGFLMPDGRMQLGRGETIAIPRGCCRATSMPS